MEAVKLSLRPIPDFNCDGYHPMKRWLNGMCHLEGGGNWHMNLLPEKSPSANPASAKASKLQLEGFNHHVNGTGTQLQHQTTSVGGGGVHPPPPPLLEATQQHLSPMPQPVLPPSLRESERMQSVERWINSIPRDALVYVQTSLTQIVPISDPKSFPDELAVSDHPSSAPINSSIGAAEDTFREGVGNYDYYSQQSQVGGCGDGGGGGGGVNSRGNTTTASTSGNPHLVPPPPHHPSGGGGGGGGGSFHPRAYHSGGGQTLLHPPPLPPHPGPADNQGIRARSFARGPPNRFFNDYETQFVVKLFRDFFANGSCPSLNEVRRRMAHSQFQGRRNANSVRAKVKRLQTSGRWKNFEVL